MTFTRFTAQLQHNP